MESYRLVSKKYFCHVCNKELKKMVQVEDLLHNGLLCDQCGQGFCEIIEAGEEKDLSKAVTKHIETSGDTSMIAQLQAHHEEAINVPPKVTITREDLRNKNTRSD